MKEIDRGVETQSDRVNLFRFGETKYVAACRVDDYAMMLEESRRFSEASIQYKEFLRLAAMDSLAEALPDKHELVELATKRLAALR